MHLAKAPLMLVAAMSTLAGWHLTAQSPALPDPALLHRLRAYATQYLAATTSVVAHEQLEQNISSRGSPSRVVVLRSDVLRLQLPGSSENVWFRDVYDVDGRPVRDREQRLLRLLESKTPGSLQAMRTIAAESARFNLGRVPRTTNVPDLVFSYLIASPEHVTLSSPRGATLAGQQLMVLRFEEIGTPTVVRSPSGRATPGRGRIWVEPESGDVVRSEVILGDVASSTTTTVDFVQHPKIGVRIPSRMEEVYRSPNEYGVGKATYTDVRTFGVTTSEQIKKPPPGASAQR